MKRATILISVISLILLLSTALSITACTPAPPTGAQTLKIGGLFGLTGFFSDFDRVQLEEAEMAAEMINAEGGIKVQGQQYNIDLIAYDFKSTMDGVNAGANQLIFQDGVKFMIAPSAFFSPPTKDIAESNKVIRGLTFITGMPQELGPDMNYTFLCHNSTLEHAKTNIAYLKQAYPNVKKLAFLHPDDGNQDYVFGKIKPMLDEAGITVSGDMILFANETADFTPIVTKALAQKPDVIFLANGVTFHFANCLKTVRQSGSNVLVIGSGDAAPTDILAIAGAENSYNYFGTGLYKGAPNTPALAQEMIDYIYTKYGERSMHLQAVNVLYMFKQAIEKANSLDTTAVRDAWAKIEKMETPYGDAHQGGMQTYGIKRAYAHPDQVWELSNSQPKFGAWIDIGAMP
jgi:branched-chain amino acid transport system substrate-binding protein